MQVKSNTLLKMAVPACLFIAIAIGVKSCGLLWSSFFGHADQMVGLCTGGQLGGRAGQRFVLCG